MVKIIDQNTAEELPEARDLQGSQNKASKASPSASVSAEGLSALASHTRSEPEVQQHKIKRLPQATQNTPRNATTMVYIGKATNVINNAHTKITVGPKQKITIIATDAKPNDDSNAQSKPAEHRGYKPALQTETVQHTPAALENVVAYAPIPHKPVRRLKGRLKAKHFFVSVFVFVPLAVFILLQLPLLLLGVVPVAIAYAMGFRYSRHSVPEHSALPQSNASSLRDLPEPERIFESTIRTYNETIAAFLDCPYKNKHAAEQLIGKMRGIVSFAASQCGLNPKGQDAWRNFVYDSALLTGYLEFYLEKKTPEQIQGILEKFRENAGTLCYKNYDESALENRNQALPFWNMYMVPEAKSLFSEIQRKSRLYTQHNIRSGLRLVLLTTAFYNLRNATFSALHRCFIEIDIAIKHCQSSYGCWGVAAGSTCYDSLSSKINALQDAVLDCSFSPEAPAEEQGNEDAGLGNLVAQLAHTAEAVGVLYNEISQTIADDQCWPSKLLDPLFVHSFKETYKQSKIANKTTCSSTPKKPLLKQSTYPYQAEPNVAQLSSEFNVSQLIAWSAEAKQQLVAHSTPLPKKQKALLNLSLDKQEKRRTIAQALEDQIWYDLWEGKEPASLSSINELGLLTQILRVIMPCGRQQHSLAKGAMHNEDELNNASIAAESFGGSSADVDTTDAALPALKGSYQEGLCMLYHFLFQVFRRALHEGCADQKAWALFDSLCRIVKSGERVFVLGEPPKHCRVNIEQYAYDANLRRKQKQDAFFAQEPADTLAVLKRVDEFMQVAYICNGTFRQEWSSELGRSRLFLKALFDASGVSLSDYIGAVLGTSCNKNAEFEDDLSDSIESSEEEIESDSEDEQPPVTNLADSSTQGVQAHVLALPPAEGLGL